MREWMRKHRSRMSPPEDKEAKRSDDRVRKIAYRQRMRDLINEAKDLPCVDCGVELPASVMDLDHVRGKKLFNVGSWESVRLSDGKSREEMVLEEIAKCDVRCPTCHRLRHYLESNP